MKRPPGRYLVEGRPIRKHFVKLGRMLENTATPCFARSNR